MTMQATDRTDDSRRILIAENSELRSSLARVNAELQALRERAAPNDSRLRELRAVATQARRLARKIDALLSPPSPSAAAPVATDAAEKASNLVRKLSEALLTLRHDFFAPYDFGAINERDSTARRDAHQCITALQALASGIAAAPVTEAGASEASVRCLGCGENIAAHFAPDQGGCAGDFRIDGVKVAPVQTTLAESKAPAEGVDDKPKCEACGDAGYVTVGSPVPGNIGAHSQPCPTCKWRRVVEQHDLCHNLHGKVDARAFADGCAAEQRKLYGCAPDADEIASLKQQLAAAQSASRSAVEGALHGLRAWIVEGRDDWVVEDHKTDILIEISRLIAEAKKGAT